LNQYTQADQDRTGISEEEAVAALNEALEVVQAIFHGHDSGDGITGGPNERLRALGNAIDWVSKWTEKNLRAATEEKDRKVALRRFDDNVLTLRQAFALSSASDRARDVRNEVEFFEAVRAQIAKRSALGTSRKSERDRELAIDQWIDKAVANVEIVDVLQAAGLKSPDISVLSPEFLEELQGMEQKNLALEALKRLLNGEIKSRSRSNVTEARQFSERRSDTR